MTPPGEGSPAREYLAWVDEARRALELAERDLENGPPRGDQVGRGSGDPVLARVLFDEDALVRRAAARSVLDDARRRIGWLGSVHPEMAGVLELRHVRGLPWAEVAGELGVSEATARRWHRVMVDWVDSFGWSRARDGRGTAEG